MQRNGAPHSRLTHTVAIVDAGPLVAANTGWKTVRPEGGAFTCEMPGEPKRTSQKVPTPAGTIDVVAYMLEGPTGTYVVSATPIPRNAPALSTQQRLDGARDGAVKGVNGTLISEKQIKLDNNPGRELLVKGPQGVFLHQRTFLINNQLVQAVAVSQSKFQPRAARVRTSRTHGSSSTRVSRCGWDERDRVMQAPERRGSPGMSAPGRLRF